MGRTLLCLILVGCGETTARGDRIPEADALCAIPDHPPDVVIGVTRHVIPIGEIRVEAGEITATGRCSEKMECIHASRETIEKLLALVRNMGRVRHREANVSPHYGYRGITVRWGGGKCELADGSVAPIDNRDEKKFYLVYDAIRDAITKSPEHAEPAEDAGATP